MRHTLLLLAACTCALSAGCVNDNLSLDIDRFLLLDPSTNMCVADPTSTVTIGHGILDTGIVGAGTTYGEVLAPVMIDDEATTMINTPPTDQIFINGFDVELQIDPSDTALQGVLPASDLKFHVPVGAGTVQPSGGTTGGTGDALGIQVEVINTDMSKAFDSAIQNGVHYPPITVHMRPTGSQAGLQGNGGYADFPVYLCRFCLGPPPAACPATGFPQAQVQDGCYPSEDSETCCTDNGFLRCGLTGVAPPVPVSMM